MTLSRWELIAYGAAGAVTSLTIGTASSETMPQGAQQTSVPSQVSSDRGSENHGGPDVFRGNDMRNDLSKVAPTRAKSRLAFKIKLTSLLYKISIVRLQPNDAFIRRAGKDPAFAPANDYSFLFTGCIHVQRPSFDRARTNA